MPAATILLGDHDAVDKTFTLSGATANGALYKDATRALSLPLTLQIAFTLGNPGSKANDKVVVSVRNTVKNATTGVVSVGTGKVELSLPRDSDAFSGHSAEDLMAYLADFFGNSTRRTEIADAMIVSQEAT
jgi:hypothetical protein